MNKIFLHFLLLMIFHSLTSQNNDLNHIAEDFLNKYNVPGIAISVIKPDSILYGVAGVKKMVVKKI